MKRRTIEDDMNAITIKTIPATLAIAAVLSGCAGTDFKRPEPSALELGKSRTADVTRVMGSPTRTGESTINGQQIKTQTYAYANTTGDSLYPGVTGARSMAFSLWNDTLVGESFVSSFKVDGTDFDDKKAAGIVKGTTTKADVVGLLGKPTGHAIYPVVKTQGNSAMIYQYTQVKGSAFNMSFFSKTLTVELDPKDVVADVTFASNGSK
jgi:outer membrane protein assembly factor BamE (lipoprotein component of BamABCDE complex)